MGRLETIRARATLKDILQGQLLHAGLIVLLASGALSLLAADSQDREFLDLNVRQWAYCSILLAVVHQILVAVVFRLELYKGLMTRIFGDRALAVWGGVFLPLLAARPVTILIVGWLDQTPVTGFRSIEVLVAIPMILIAIMTMHSVIKYFSIRRAIGADHFDNKVIALPPVDQGMFKYTSNAMYGLVFLGLWGIALAFGSWNAFIVAFFQHVYIWVHMVLTEQPDIDRIYGRKDQKQ